MSETPFLAQSSTSDFLIRRDALVMSGCWTPTPEQNSFRPPPEPVLSTTGVLKPLVLPKVSATVVENGKTVDDPTMRIWSRASAAAATAITPARASGIALRMEFLSTIWPPGNRSVIDRPRYISERDRPVPTPLRSPYYYRNVKVLFQPAAKSCDFVTPGATQGI